MRIGVPREQLRNEHRVGLTPFAVQRLIEQGHEIWLEHDAGADSHFTDDDYAKLGVKIAFSRDEVYGRADLVCRVGPLHADEIELVRPGSTVIGFLQLAVAGREQIAKLGEKQVTAIGYELVEQDGRRTVLKALAEIAGHISISTAAHLLERNQGGRGLLLGSTPGLPPATVVILGAGTGGRAAARVAAAMGSHVILLDTDYAKLRRAHYEVPGPPVTAVAFERNIERYVAIADVVIGAVFSPGRSSPVLVSEAMVQSMKPGSVIVDLSLGLGNCIATSRPTDLANPTFQAHGVIHHCVPNITAAVPRTSSRALAIAAEPFVGCLANDGLPKALERCPGLGSGIYLYAGQPVHERVAALAGVAPTPLTQLLH